MANASFEMRTSENFDGLRMKQYLDRMEDKMKRGAVRKMVAASGTLLAKEVRAQLKRRDMPYSRARNAAERKKTRQANQKPLSRTIGTKPWSRPNRGVIGSVVGPRYDTGGYHGHLVEFGHKITGRRRLKKSFSALAKTGKFGKKLFGTKGLITRMAGHKRIKNAGGMTVAHYFQSEAMKVSEPEVFIVMEQALSAFIRKQGTRKLS